MRKNLLLCTAGFLFLTYPLFSQENTKEKKDIIIPYAGIFYGGCDVSIPFSFMAGIQQVKSTHFSIAYDVHYWNTKYECYCDDMYSKGRFSSITPSVKLIYSTGKKTANGFFAGAGIGYMIAKDRGTEQAYTTDPLTSEMLIGKDKVNGRWDFTSLAPSVTLGVSFRMVHLPVSISNTYYFAKTTEGWEAAAGGIGLKIGFRRLER